MTIDIQQSLYLRIGGEQGLQTFVKNLYDFMEVTPEVKHVRNMHPDNMDYARDRLFMFLSGMLGGPSLYMDAFGPPRLRRKHMGFEIGNKERDQWMQCAHYAAGQLPINEQDKKDLVEALDQMANHLRNTGSHNTQCQAS